MVVVVVVGANVVVGVGWHCLQSRQGKTHSTGATTSTATWATSGNLMHSTHPNISEGQASEQEVDFPLLDFLKWPSTLDKRPFFFSALTCVEVEAEQPAQFTSQVGQGTQESVNPLISREDADI